MAHGADTRRITTNLAERLCWQVAHRDARGWQATVPQEVGMACIPWIRSVAGLVLFTSSGSGVFALLEDVRGKGH